MKSLLRLIFYSRLLKAIKHFLNLGTHSPWWCTQAKWQAAKRLGAISRSGGSWRLQISWTM